MKIIKKEGFLCTRNNFGQNSERDAVYMTIFCLKAQINVLCMRDFVSPFLFKRSIKKKKKQFAYLPYMAFSDIHIFIWPD